jgi:hypothetical protein
MIQVKTTSPTNKPFAGDDPAIDKPASRPTSDILKDMGARILYAKTNTTTATSIASALRIEVALGRRVATELVIEEPWTKSPVENPIAPKNIPNRLVTILEPTAGPMQADKLLPATSITARNTKTTRATVTNSNQNHLRIEVTADTITSDRSSALSKISSHLCSISL